MQKIILGIIISFFCLGKAEAAGRYISLAPSTTEILFALGLKDEVAGVSSYCNYPQEALSKERVGDFSHPNLEKIFSLRPDYIFCTGLEQAPTIQELKRLKLNVYVADPANMAELFSSIEDIGKITGKSIEAAELIRKMKSEIAEIGSKVSGIPLNDRVRVFVEIWHEPLMTAGKGSFVDELIYLAGGVNVAHDTMRPYSIYSAEKVVSLNPGCIILAYMDKGSPVQLVSGRYGWKNIEAIKNNRVFNDINPDVLLRPGPRVIDGLKEIYKKLYPLSDEK